MGILRQIWHWIAGPPNVHPESITILSAPTLITPKQFYDDCMYLIKHKRYEARYLEKVARKKSDSQWLQSKYKKFANTGEIVEKVEIETRRYSDSRETYTVEHITSVDLKDKWGTRKKIVTRETEYHDILKNPELPNILLQIMITPFMVLLYDLNIEDTESDLSWYHKAKRKISQLREDAKKAKELSVNDSQIARIHGVVSRLDMFEAELDKVVGIIEKYCVHAIEYLETMLPIIKELIADELIKKLERDAASIAHETTRKVRKNYDELQEHVRKVNASLAVFGTDVSIKLDELSPENLLKLEQGSAQIISQIDEIQRSYFGDAIVAYGKETA